MLLNKVEISSNVKLDFFHIETNDSSEDIFENPKYKPVLNNYSRFLITFDDGTTISHGIADVALGYTFSIYREKKDSNNLEYVASLQEGELSITDYNISNEKDYRYYIFKEDEDAMSEAVTSNYVRTCWWDWSIIGLIKDLDTGIYYVDNDNVWKFNLNISSAQKVQNVNNTVYNNMAKFPKVSIGKSNYTTGSLTCLLGNIQKSPSGKEEYYEPDELLDKWNDFCANGEIKFLRDRKGNSLLINIKGTSSQISDETKEQVNEITFDWVQIGDAKDISIIGGKNE